jgi:hypothetical protein
MSSRSRYYTPIFAGWEEKSVPGVSLFWRQPDSIVPPRPASSVPRSVLRRSSLLKAHPLACGATRGIQIPPRDLSRVTGTPLEQTAQTILGVRPLCALLLPDGKSGDHEGLLPRVAPSGSRKPSLTETFHPELSGPFLPQCRARARYRQKDSGNVLCCLPRLFLWGGMNLHI